MLAKSKIKKSKGFIFKLLILGFFIFSLPASDAAAAYLINLDQAGDKISNFLDQVSAHFSKPPHTLAHAHSLPVKKYRQNNNVSFAVDKTLSIPNPPAVFSDLNSRLNWSIDKLVFSLSDSTYSAFSKAREMVNGSIEDLNSGFTALQEITPVLKSIADSSNPASAFKKIIAVVGDKHNLTTTIVSSPTPVTRFAPTVATPSTPSPSPVFTSTSLPVPTVDAAATDSSSIPTVSDAGISGIENSSLVAEHKVFKLKGSKDIYLYKNGSLHFIPDLPTLKSFGFGAQDVHEISAGTFALFKVGVAVDTVISPFSNKQTSFIESLIKRIIGQENVVSPIDTSGAVTIQGSISDLNLKLADLTARVNQIPPPLQYFGGGGSSGTTSVGGSNSEIFGSKLTISSNVVSSGGISTPSLTVTGTTILNGVTYTWPSADGSASQVLKTNGSGTLSWTTVSSSGGSSGTIGARVSGGTFSHAASLTFDAGHFDITNLTASESYVRLDWTNGPASRSIAQTWSGLQTFSVGASSTTNFEVTGNASASAFFGAGLNSMTGTTGCSGATADKLLYNATTGKFSCGADQTGGITAQSGVAANQIMFFKDAGVTASGSANFLFDASGRLVIGATAQTGSSVLTIASASARFTIKPTAVSQTASASIDFLGNGVTTNNQSKFTLEAGGLAGTSSESFNILNGSGQKLVSIASSGLMTLLSGTTAKNGINFGDSTANLYRSAAGTLRTDASEFMLGGTSILSRIIGANAGGTGIDVKGAFDTIAGTQVAINSNGGSQTAASGTYRTLMIGNTVAGATDNFIPTSGTTVLNILELGNTINQTGTANGITRGEYTNPTLTSAYDYRQFETASSTYRIHANAGTLPTTLQSSLLNGFYISSSSTQTITNAYNVNVSGVPVASGSVTLTNAVGLNILGNSVIAAGGAVTNAYGLFVNTPTGATNNLAAALRSTTVSGMGSSVSLQFLPNNGATQAKFTLTAGGLTSGSTPTSESFSILNGNNAKLVTIASSGYVGIGITASRSLLQIGSANQTTSTYGLMFGNDTSANLYRSAAGTIRTDGDFTAGLLNIHSSNLSVTTTDTPMNLTIALTSIARTALTIAAGNNLTGTSGTYRTLQVGGVADKFNPISGSAIHNILEIASAINQTGTANGITRGEYTNPTLTSAYDYRQFETASSTYRIHANAGTLPTTLQSSLLNGFYISSSSTQTITNAYNVNVSGAPVASGSVTLTNAVGLNILGNSVTAAGGAVTNAYGLFVNTPTGATNNFAIGVRSTSALSSVASISATGLAGGDVFNITVPASTSANNPHGLLLVKNVAGTVIASWSMGGTLALRGNLYDHGTTSNCTAVNTPSSGCIDLAEEFPTTDQNIGKGDLVSVDAADNAESTVKRSASPYDTGILGIVTTKPGIVLAGGVYSGGTAENYQAPAGKTVIALAGRVPVKISFENGDIKKGDYLTSSSTAGLAMKATKKGRVVGMALENASSDSGKTSIMTLINPHWAGEELDANGQLADLSGLSPILQDNIGFFQAMLDYFKNAVLNVKELFAGKVTTQELCVGNTCVNEEQLKQILQNLNTQLYPAPIVSPQEEIGAGQAPTPTPSIIDSPTPTTTPSITIESPTPTPDSASSPQASPSETPLASPSETLYPAPIVSPQEEIGAGQVPTPTPSESPTVSP